MAGRKEIITFKVDESLAAAMHGIPNRSAFIRSAILSALNGSCPLCKGTGILTPEQKKNWDQFASRNVGALESTPGMGLEETDYQPQHQPGVSAEKTEIGNKF
jgi:hypothetical protein